MNNPKTFFESVTKWIMSCCNATQLDHVENFVNVYCDNENNKQQLLVFIAGRRETIPQPCFAIYKDGLYLSDDKGYVRVFKSEFKARAVANCLNLQLHDVEVVESLSFYRIKKV